MPDPFKPVQPGEPVVFSAMAWNRMLAAAEATNDRRNDGGAARKLTTSRSADIIRIRNDTGLSLPRRSVVSVGFPVWTPSDSEDAFLREVVFKGVIPVEHTYGTFAITLEPCPAIDRAICRAYIAGVCQVMIDVLDVAHTGADIIPGDTTKLQSAGGGAVQIIWREGLSELTEEGDDVGYVGEQWAIVRFGYRSGGKVMQTKDIIGAGTPSGPGGPGTATMKRIQPSGAYGALQYVDVREVPVVNAMPVEIEAGQTVIVLDVDGYWMIVAVPCLDVSPYYY